MQKRLTCEFAYDSEMLPATKSFIDAPVCSADVEKRSELARLKTVQLPIDPLTLNIIYDSQNSKYWSPLNVDFSLNGIRIQGRLSDFRAEPRRQMSGIESISTVCLTQVA